MTAASGQSANRDEQRRDDPDWMQPPNNDWSLIGGRPGLGLAEPAHVSAEVGPADVAYSDE